MSLEENKAIVRSFLDALNQQDLSSLDDFVAPDYYDHTNQFRGLDIIKQTIRIFFKGFPDFHVNIEDMIAEGDKVWVHETETGTHTGAYRGIAPTGKKITFSCVDIFHIVDGKFAEGWHVYDFLNFYTQLDVIEYKGFPGEEIIKGLMSNDHAITYLLFLFEVFNPRSWLVSP
jgi:predicted ester cyclase